MPTIEHRTTPTRSGREWLSRVALIGVLLFVGAIGWITRPWEDEPETPLGMVDADGGAPRPAAPAPDFRLVRNDESVLRLSDLRGQPVFLNFWATWCTFCLEEMPDMQRIAEEYDDRVVVVGVNAGDSIASGSDFAERIGVRYELVYDTTQEVTRGYSVRAMPSSYFIDANGEIVEAHFGFMSYEDMRENVEALLASSE